jgi:hypothetical protein
LAGLLCGWAVVLDYSGVVILLVLSLYGFARRMRLPEELKSNRDIWQFMLGVAACAVVLMAYQWSSFGHPIFPAQRYMPPTEFSHYGYNGLDRPHLDLLWQTAFGMRFGLFTSAPILLLALYIPGWISRRKRLLGDLETYCVIALTVVLFVFCSANQFGRLQFNSGVRYIVPAVPFLFLLSATVLTHLPRVLAGLLAIVCTYWVWCQAMYRDVELGLGVLEPVKRITLEGFRLPWLTTLENLGYVARDASPLPLFLLCGAVIWLLWSDLKNRKTQTSVATLL